MFSVIHISANANLSRFYFQMLCVHKFYHTLQPEYYNLPELQPIRELEQVPDWLFFLQYDRWWDSVSGEVEKH